jgi:hypothetical protein
MAPTCRSPYSLTQPDPSLGIGFHSTVSFLRWITRVTLKPHSCSGAGAKRSCESGMRNSAVQPSLSTLVATSHTASQAKSMRVSS